MNLKDAKTKDGNAIRVATIYEYEQGAEMEGSPTIDLADSGDYKLGYCQTEYDALLSIGFDSPGATGKNIPRQKARDIFWCSSGDFPYRG